ncbi:Calmodulin-binding protein 60 B-like protein [Drosera capensis]
MSNRMWDALMEHAKTCVLSGMLYVYYPDDTRNVGAVFNNIYELSGLISGEQYLSADSLSDSQKVLVDNLVKKAYENWHQVFEYDGKSLLNSKQARRSSASSTSLSTGSTSFPDLVGHHIALPPLPLSSDQRQIHSSTAGYNGELTHHYINQLMNSNPQSQFESTPFSLENLIDNPRQIHMTRNKGAVALDPPPSSTSHHSTQNLYAGWSDDRDQGADYLTNEEEIRLRSHEMLENEDMQQFLRLFSIGPNSSINMPDEASYQPFAATPLPNFTFGEDPARPAKAAVGWLKIKAAMRWGFFVRKKASERRAKLVEIEDE